MLAIATLGLATATFAILALMCAGVFKALSEPAIPSSRFPSALQYFTAYDPSVVLPGNATVQTCYITIPFEHFLRTAVLNCSDIDNVGTVGAQLMVAADAGAKAGTLVGTALTDTDLASTADVMKKFDIALAAADTGAVRAAFTSYHIQLSGNDAGAGDHIEQPHLTIGVEPTTRTRL